MRGQGSCQLPLDPRGIPCVPSMGKKRKRGEAKATRGLMTNITPQAGPSAGSGRLGFNVEPVEKVRSKNFRKKTDPRI